MRGRAGSAACLFAMLAIASCTSADGLVPPADIGPGPSPGFSQMAPQAAAPQPEAQSVAAARPAPSASASPALRTTLPSASPAGAQVATQSALPAFAGPEPSGTEPPAGPVVAAVATRSTIQVAPITGAPPDTVTPLTARLTAHARERGIQVAGGGTLPTHILKGYLSELTDANSTTVIYVWDVVDPAGTRLHRIQGTAKVKGKGGWSAVSAKTMQAIADRTIDDFANWLTGGAG
jgi:hypothetical protein